MAKKSTTDIPGDKLVLYESLVSTRPDIERKGATMPYTSLNGHMFSFLTKEGTLALRLSDGVPQEVQNHAMRAAWTRHEGVCCGS